MYELLGRVTVLVTIVWLLVKVCRGLWTSFIANALGLGVKWCPSDNTWAVITGATDGIGKAYAKRMAQMGYNLLIISRNEDKLNKTKDEILSKYKKCSEVRILAVDFTRSDIYERLEATIGALDDIHVLINNVGISYAYPEYFTQIPQSQQLIESIINCNIIAMTRIIEMVLPKMEAKRRGVIINVSSYSASYPMPLLSLYASSKIFVDFLSRALQVEYASKGITIQSVLPAYVMTNMSKIRRSSLMVPTPDVYVSHAMKTVGIESRTYGYWPHKLQGFIQDSIISNTLGSDFNIKLAFNALKDVRRRYYKKEGLKEKVN
ncbi:unnamed protein product [Medioppia subpectinata]|uniref:Uncharacterized protein n=1 Tax=Medioppia subpectinata TaxID=1979941 RepID=A0A7R9Q4M1_9ACAR|nr:unnamed protein product [Medioppia subpectinata]CAG2111835.1 unnamed protein product [Medioppia subpectinata]